MKSISTKLLAILCVIGALGGVAFAVAAYPIVFTPSTTHVNAVVSGVVQSQSTANVGDVITVTAQLNQALSGVPIQFTSNGVNLNAPVNTDASGKATTTYTATTADAGTNLVFSATATRP